jgi:hypothetical protein
MAEMKLSETISTLRDLLVEVEKGEGPGVVVLIASPDNQMNVFTINLTLPKALVLTSNCTEMFQQTMQKMNEEMLAHLPEGGVVWH